ncbi:MAG: hypothetical protein KatS3mg113_0888 [Planctomycetaceae bacterium]|nr:MAG: hypothetical protein KatS3mg113_0888 [Planctomycetaceae bacterium]
MIDSCKSATPFSREEWVRHILDELDSTVRAAERQIRPLELDPYRTRLFELFVVAYREGLLQEESEPNLSADAVCKALAERWGLAAATRLAHANQTSLSAEQLAQMRLLWSLLRLWMEWDYAWRRWEEYHGTAGVSTHELMARSLVPDAASQARQPAETLPSVMPPMN